MLTARPFPHVQMHVISGPVGAEKTQVVETFLDGLVDSGFKRDGNVVVVRHSDDDIDPSHIGRHDVAVRDNVDGIFDLIKEETETLMIVGSSHYREKKIVSLADCVVRSGRKVVAAGLNLNYHGRPYGHMADLMGLATHVTVMKSICHICGDDRAGRSIKIRNEFGEYGPVCNHHAAYPELPPVVPGEAGSLTLYLGSMYAGKSTRWLRSIDMLRSAGRNLAVFKYLRDDRDGMNKGKVGDLGEVTIHSGRRVQGVMVEKAEDIMEYLHSIPKVRDVAIDEGQFIRGLYDLVAEHVSKGYRFHINGLIRGFNRAPFGDIPSLMCMADDIKMSYALCVHKRDGVVCGGPTTENQRLKRLSEDGPVEVAHLDDELELIGGRDKRGARYFYEARCLDHWSLHGEKKNYELPRLKGRRDTP